MNSSSSPSRDQQIQEFPYLETSSTTAVKMPTGTDVILVHAGEIARRESAAREAGYREGEAKARAGFEGEISQLRSVIADAVQHFIQEQETYYERIESEVVQLALAIARKIIHRES